MCNPITNHFYLSYFRYWRKFINSMNFDIVKVKRIILRWTFQIILKIDDTSHLASSKIMTKKQEEDCEDETKISNLYFLSTAEHIYFPILFLKRFSLDFPQFALRNLSTVQSLTILLNLHCQRILTVLLYIPALVH